jgi:RNA polymerase sigma factor (TIGR02999 family)
MTNDSRPGDVTVLLQAWSRGDREAMDRLTPLVYAELRRLAAGYMRRERAGHTLQPTALVHEAYVRMVGLRLDWQDRAHFFAVAARQMRHILVDHVRKGRAHKRGGGQPVITFDEALFADERSPDLAALDDALDALAAFDADRARAVELRYFGGLTQEEIALVLGVHVNTVARQLRLAEAWLAKEMRRSG